MDNSPAFLSYNHQQLLTHSFTWRRLDKDITTVQRIRDDDMVTIDTMWSHFSPYTYVSTELIDLSLGCHMNGVIYLKLFCVVHVLNATSL